MTKSSLVQSSPSPYFKTPSDDKPLVKLTAAKKEIPIQNASAQFSRYIFMLFLKTSNRLLSHSVCFFFKWLEGPLSPLRFSSHLGL